MKKLIAIFLLLYLLSGCNSYTNEPISEGLIITDDHHYEIAVSDAIFLLDENGTVFVPPLSFQLRGHPWTITRTFDSGEDRVFDGATFHLYTVNNAFVRWPALAFDDNNNFYMPLSGIYNGQESQRIMRFNKSVGSRRIYEGYGTVIREFDSSMYINFFVENDYMILIEPIFTDSHFIYNVIKLNLLDGYESLIISKEYCMTTEFGDVIANIFVKNGYIYSYRILFSDNGQRYYIDRYDFYGNMLSSYYLDISRFIYMHEVSDEDSVTNIFVIDNYFIFTTLHNRIAIFKLESNSLSEIYVPYYLQQLGAVVLIRNFAQCNGLVYFQDLRNNRMHIFDTDTGQFFSLNFSLQLSEFRTMFQEDLINNILRDGEGNILIQFRTDFNAYTYWMESMLDYYSESPMGGSGIPPDTSFFYFVGIDEIRLNKTDSI